MLSSSSTAVAINGLGEASSNENASEAIQSYKRHTKYWIFGMVFILTMLGISSGFFNGPRKKYDALQKAVNDNGCNHPKDEMAPCNDSTDKCKPFCDALISYIDTAEYALPVTGVVVFSALAFFGIIVGCFLYRRRFAPHINQINETPLDARPSQDAATQLIPSPAVRN